MLPVEKAREIILSQIRPVPAEKVMITEMLGRFLAEDIVSGIDIPPGDNSAMDGYAIKRDDITGEDTNLKIAYTLAAGNVPRSTLTHGEAVRIMTGALIPPGADTVVKREDTIESNDTVVINKIPAKGENIRFAGEDIKKGEVVLKKGTRMGPAQIGILASVKRSAAYCAQRPLVAVLATGDEVIDIDDEASYGKIISSNSYTLMSLVRETGAIPIYLGISKDNREDLEYKLSAAYRADLILTSGGVSMGDYDLVKDVMQSGGNRMEFWKVEMKPGKPLAFGEILGIPAIGLPGNPVSSMVSFYQFARPAILKMMGSRYLLLPRVNARLKTEIKKKPDRRHYLRGVLKLEQDEFIVYTTGPQGSGILSSMSMANCLIVVPKDKTYLPIGESVTCEIIDASW